MTIFFTYSWNMSAGHWPKNTQQWDRQGWTRKRSLRSSKLILLLVSRGLQRIEFHCHLEGGEKWHFPFSALPAPPAMSKILELKLLLPIWCAVVTVMH